MKDKQFNMRLSNDDQELLNNLSQKLHLPYSKVIILALHCLEYMTEVCYSGHYFINDQSIWDNYGLVARLNLWKRIL